MQYAAFSFHLRAFRKDMECFGVGRSVSHSALSLCSVGILKERLKRKAFPPLIMCAEASLLKRRLLTRMECPRF
ncbi:hypothetical protein ECG_00677 [Echinococcus granulosus]|uniref:Uncharacterized protein n=1 Tax=Echinococcus granulosus TaxID=6210 RepID=A0A068WFS3_ECHGR|nr:hypothetical protein ECG_00677 [Echinococcus granulosus]CDS16465.1 hypothetical protein EgrG_000888850 [Echinococcus granulosus]